MSSAPHRTAGFELSVLALLIDGLNLIRRIHAAQARNDDAEAPALARALEGSIQRALRVHRPTHAALVMDGGEPTWRHERWPAYKASRPPMPPDLSCTLEALLADIGRGGAKQLQVKGFEADDVIASVAVRLTGRGAGVVVLSTDTTFCQLLADGVEVYDHFAAEHRDAEFVRQRFGVSPALLPSVLALAGVSSTGIPGVRGIGVKTAARIVNRHGPLESLLERPEEVPGRPGALLREALAEARLSLELVTLRRDVQVGANLSELRVAA